MKITLHDSYVAYSFEITGISHMSLNEVYELIKDAFPGPRFTELKRDTREDEIPL